MTSNRQFGLLPKGANQRRPTLHRFESPGCVASDFGDRLNAQIAQLALLSVAEQVLDRIGLGRVTGETLEGDLAVEGLDVVTHEPAAVRRQAVPDDQQLAFDR